VPPGNDTRATAPAPPGSRAARGCPGSLMPVELRLGRDDDAEAIRHIYNTEVLGSTSTFDLVPRNRREQAAWMRSHQGAHPVIVAVEGDVIAGFGSLSPYRDRPAYATTVEDSVYVERAWRGKGVGRALLDELLSVASARGFHAVIARISGGNEASVKLHQRLGFELVGIEREVGRKHGRWLDVVVMQRLLAGPAQQPRLATPEAQSAPPREPGIERVPPEPSGNRPTRTSSAPST
jgi:L-amino acid N-acyltransferase YncA